MTPTRKRSNSCLPLLWWPSAICTRTCQRLHSWSRTNWTNPTPLRWWRRGLSSKSLKCLQWSSLVGSRSWGRGEESSRHREGNPTCQRFRFLKGALIRVWSEAEVLSRNSLGLDHSGSKDFWRRRSRKKPDKITRHRTNQTQNRKSSVSRISLLSKKSRNKNKPWVRMLKERKKSK